jgi:tRNA(adenine34) deaminase
MRRALQVARQGLEIGEMPIGAVLTLDDRIIGEAYWGHDLAPGLLEHPEHVVLLEADMTIGRRRRDATLYTTLEPCLMCMGTAMSFFLGRIVFALRAGADGATNVVEQWAPPLGHPTDGAGAYAPPQVEGGLCADESAALLEEWLATGVEGGMAEFARKTLGFARRG